MAAAVIEEPVVVTSLETGAQFQEQLACLRRWQALGVRALSFNGAAERSQLLAAGLEADALVEVAEHETVSGAAGRACPRLSAVLAWLLDAGAPRALFVDSHVFPFVSRNPLPLMGALGDIVALCRGDGLCAAGTPARAEGAHVTGVEGFVFSRGGLAGSLELVPGPGAAETWTLGEPGWEWPLASLVLQMRSTVLDSGPLLRRRMPASPAQGAHSMRSAWLELSSQLGSRLASHCLQHRDHARALRLALGEPPVPSDVASAPEPADGALRALHGTLEPAEVSALLDSQVRRPDWHALYASFQRLEAAMTPMSAYLEAVRAAIVLAGQRGAPRWSTLSPQDAAHAKRHRQTLSDLQGSVAQRRLLNLFAQDLHEQGVLNLTLLKYVLAMCRHEAEQRRFQALLRLLKERVDEPTAAA